MTETFSNFSLKDQAAWAALVKESESDFYGMGILSFASRWAALMEVQIARGVTITPKMMRDTEREADTEGISGFMYGAAVSRLSDHWVYGEALRRVHNKDIQIGDEGDVANNTGGTLNPALLTISIPKGKRKQ